MWRFVKTVQNVFVAAAVALAAPGAAVSAHAHGKIYDKSQGKQQALTHSHHSHGHGDGQQVSGHDQDASPHHHLAQDHARAGAHLTGDCPGARKGHEPASADFSCCDMTCCAHGALRAAAPDWSAASVAAGYFSTGQLQLQGGNPAGLERPPRSPGIG